MPLGPLAASAAAAGDAPLGEVLVGLGGTFLMAALLARAGRRIGLPTIPLFMLAGILLGPNTPAVVLVGDPDELRLLAALGLVLLLFHLGLEFSLGDLAAGGRRLLMAGVAYLIINVGVGLGFGLALGWGNREALVIAGAVGISSSAIVTKLLVELRRLANPETRLILGIIVVEDVFLALYLAVLTPVVSGTTDGTAALLSVGRSFLFLVVLVGVARYAARHVGRLVAGPDDELLTVGFIGLVLLVAGLAEQVGVSDAIGAFMVGLVLAETSVKERVARLVLPLRDAFAAAFFFVFGLTIDPGDLARVALPVAVAVVITVVANTSAGILAARMHDLGRRPAANVSMTIVSRGEFSLILASLAAGAGLDARVGPFVAGYVLVLALGGPLLAARSARLAPLIPQRLLTRR